MSDNKPLHPGIQLAEAYIESLRVPVRYVARMTEIQLEVAEAFFIGAADLNRHQAEKMEELLRGWKTADWIEEEQEASKSIDVDNELE